MWIVQLALRRPYTFVIMSLLIVILGVSAIVRMPTDIFPEIDIPVVSVIWSYGGVSPEEMAEIITVRCERSFTTSVNDIEHMESESLPGLGDHPSVLSSARAKWKQPWRNWRRPRRLCCIPCRPASTAQHPPL